MAQYRRWRAADRRTWQATLPRRLAGVLAAGVVAALATTVVAGLGLARVTGPAAAIGLAWLLRFRPSPATMAWRHGAQGERRTARLLAPWSSTATRSSTTSPSPGPRPTSIIWSWVLPACS
jgi:hypothetical protein